MEALRNDDCNSLLAVGDGSLRLSLNRPAPEQVLIRLAGQLKQDTSLPVGELAHAQLCDPQVRQLTLDLSGVAFMDSQALGMLVLLSRQAQARTVRLVLMQPRLAVRRLFELTRLASMFEIETADESVGSSDLSAMRVPLATPPRQY
jgi:anti-anti-sigma factor